MEYVYGALLLHSAKQAVNEENVSKVLTAAGVSPDAARVKAMVAALDGVNIDEAISKAAIPVAAPVAAGEAKQEEEEEKKEENTAKKAEEAAAGLGALFG